MDYGIANTIGHLEQKEVNQIVSFAVENGIHFFDTAQSYGNSEFVLGKAQAKLENNHFVRIVSKLSPHIQECSTDIIVNSFKSSLQKLNVESLHGFLAHRLEAINTESYALAVHKLKSDGLIIKSGVSVYTPEDAKTALENPLVEILQIPFNILDRRWIDEGIFDKAEEKSVQLFFRSIFLQGLIFLSNGDLERQKMDWAKPYMNQFHKLVSETTLTPIELSFEILSNIPGDNVIIMGIDSFEQLQENMKLIDKIRADKKFDINWWSNLPTFPEKLLNPTSWN